VRGGTYNFHPCREENPLLTDSLGGKGIVNMAIQTFLSQTEVFAQSL